MEDKILNLLGLCKKAGMLSVGHDASFESIEKGKAKLCLLCIDASQRLKSEFEATVIYKDRNVPLINLNNTMEEIWKATGSKAAVLTINNEGFANKIQKLNEQKHGEDNN